MEFFFSSAAAIFPSAYWNILFDLWLVAMNEFESSLYFVHSNTSGRPHLDDAPASTLDVLTVPLRTFHFSSVYFISALFVMVAIYQVCSGVDYQPIGAGIWLMQFRLSCSST